MNEKGRDKLGDEWGMYIVRQKKHILYPHISGLTPATTPRNIENYVVLIHRAGWLALTRR